MTARWETQKERGTPFALHLMRWIACYLGRTPARLLLYPISLYFLVANPGARKASHAYLSRLDGRPATWRHTFKHIHTFAAVILDRVYFLQGKTHYFDIRIQGLETVKPLFEQGGVLLIGSHLGSFEAVRCSGIQSGKLKLKILMQHDHNRVITQLLEALNAEIAASVIPTGQLDSLLRAFDWLAAGGSLGILGDRITSKRRSLACTFLGDQAHFPTNPWWLAAHTKAPVVLFFGLYQGKNRYDIYLHHLEHIPSITMEIKDLQPCMQKYVDILEQYVRQSPYNWFNFYDFWLSATEDDTWDAPHHTGKRR